VGRVLPIATVRDSGGLCDLHEAVIGHKESVNAERRMAGDRL
jgi:hypothetical protein